MAKKKMVIYKNGAFHEISGSGGGGGGSGGDAEFDSITVPSWYSIINSADGDTLGQFISQMGIITTVFANIVKAGSLEFQFKKYDEINGDVKFLRLKIPCDDAYLTQFNTLFCAFASQIAQTEITDFATAEEIITTNWGVLPQSAKETLLNDLLISIPPATSILCPPQYVLVDCKQEERGFANTRSDSLSNGDVFNTNCELIIDNNNTGDGSQAFLFLHGYECGFSWVEGPFDDLTISYSGSPDSNSIATYEFKAFVSDCQLVAVIEDWG